MDSGATNWRDGVELPQFLLKALAGKRYALIDFEPPQLNAIVAILDEIGAFSRTVDIQQIQTHPSVLNPFDICICKVSRLPIGEAGWMPGGSADKPALLVGTLQEILRQTLKDPCRMRDFLVEPWHPHDLLLRSFHLLHVSRQAVPADAATVEPTVIIADDDSTTTTLIATLLRKYQVKSVVARDGGEAIQAVNNVRAQVMVLDVNMPKVSGFEVLQAIKHGDAAIPIKVAMLTSRQQETDVVRAFGLGADDYIVKPFNPLELVSRVKRLLRN